MAPILSQINRPTFQLVTQCACKMRFKVGVTFPYNFYTIMHAMAEEVVAGFSLQRPVFDPMPMYVGFVVHRVVRGQVFLRILFCFVSIVPPMLCTQSSNVRN
jgi:hypothetical protein